MQQTDKIEAVSYERTIALEGCGNFRDLGGYEGRHGRRVRWRRLFRSDALVWLTPDDMHCLAGQGIKLTVGLDLRTHDELKHMGHSVLYENGTKRHHLPFLPTFGEDKERARSIAYATGQVAGDRYLEILAESRPCFEGLFEILSNEANFPAAYYCAAGKDRTGMVTAILLRALGVSDDQIIIDYALTQAPSEERIISRMKALGRDTSTLPDRTALAAYPETMEHFLASFDRLHGSAEDFLLSCNVQESTIERVRENLLES
jgi:protein-tyrosine phosphatase